MTESDQNGKYRERPEQIRYGAIRSFGISVVWPLIIFTYVHFVFFLHRDDYVCSPRSKTKKSFVIM